MTLAKPSITLAGRCESRPVVASLGLAYAMLKPVTVNVKRFLVLPAGWGQIFLAFWLMAEQISSAQILPANRTPGGQGNWVGLVGVPGGIPAVTTIYTTIAAGASLATIQNAINACPSNQVVLLSAGTYNLSGTLQINRNGVVLRGSGPGATTLNFSGGYLYVGDQNWYSDFATPSSAPRSNITGGLTQGSTSITLSSASGFVVGQLVMIDQLNDADVDYVGHCNGPVPGLYTSVAHPGVGNDRWQYQVDRIVGISGNTLTLENPIYAPFFNSANSPQAWTYGAQPWVKSGVENLSIVGAGGSAQGIYFQNASGCWATNVNVTNCRYGINAMFTDRLSIIHCSVTSPSLPSDSYNFQLITSSGLLVENNINVGGTLMMNGISGCVIAYNYLQGTTGSSGYMQGGLLTHGANPNMNLYEGNYAPGVWWENCWGSSEYITAFRNRLVGNDEHPNSGVTISYDKEAINAGQYQRYESVVGNVMGNPATTGYEDSGISYTCHSTSGRIYYLGEVGPGNAYSDCSTSYDPIAVSTLFRAVNYDTETSINAGIVLGGYSLNNLSSSLYLPGKPAFFGTLNWPPYSPNNSTLGGIDRTNLPAGYRFVYGVDPPAASGSTVPAPSPKLAFSWSASPNTVAVGSSVYFQYTAYAGSSNCIVEFGDGASSTANPVSHAYSSAGAYPIFLDTIQANGTTNRLQKDTIVVTNSP